MRSAPGIITRKRDGLTLATEEIEAFVSGLTTATWSDSQIAAFAMAVVLNGMHRQETVALTAAMAASGDRLRWPADEGPYIDKHSTGGVGDKVSLILAPWLAACGAKVPMISGRSLGHTGGTLDKLESIPGYQVVPSAALLRQTLGKAGCAIIGASQTIAPADRKLYAIRDVTATVESVPLVVSSILSKKLAAGAKGLVLDVKVGTGAFTASLREATTLATELVAVANDAGLPTSAVLTDMNQVLGRCAGNSLEVAEAVEFLKGDASDARLYEICLQLAIEGLLIGGVTADHRTARAMLEDALGNGRALECFAEMVAMLGGPTDFCERIDRYLPRAPVIHEVRANVSGVVGALDVKAIGLLVVYLGGGRTQAADRVDHRVGLSDVRAPGAKVMKGERLATVHAASEDAAAKVEERLRGAIEFSMRQDDAQSSPAQPVIVEKLRPARLP